jgi:hypothetical protein
MNMKYDTKFSYKFFIATFSHIRHKIPVKVFFYVLMFVGLVNSAISLNYLTSSTLSFMFSTLTIFCFVETTMCFPVSGSST